MSKASPLTLVGFSPERPANQLDYESRLQELIDLEKSFIYQKGLQDRPWNRSLFTAEDPFSGYGSWMLPGLRYELEHDSVENIQSWEAVYVKSIESLATKIRKLTESLSTAG